MDKQLKSKSAKLYYYLVESASLKIFIMLSQKIHPTTHSNPLFASMGIGFIL